MEGREARLRRYRDGCNAVVEAVARLKPEDLDRATAGEWTPRQIVHHLADTELFRSTRLRRLLTEESPTLQAFDEGNLTFLRRLHYDRPIEASFALFRAASQTNLDLLARLLEDDWSREGTHTEVGRFTMDDWLERAAGHAQDHAEQILKDLA